ncbi:MAG: hypothetical protein US11_C0002G0019 [Candidatus Roizmanbacteria bacterium GW2011_GWA2_36_23]|uniref:HMA domain-containing protein n=1 Tax=Candidatus Roizmanbacteria bacterium GW2011_GWA2_36_23 TaxID=1618480 RepID=A0A0G0ELJ7_9BACT|nr:MAG: hypothetical protein US11_C0002G0019 [Candidatus Roizmanbacteria bacterium GW2011_GWA2_36_23]
MNKTTVPIKGMHCRSCEILIEDELTKIPGVTKVKVDYRRNEAIICTNDKIEYDKIQAAISNVGYSIGYESKKPWFSKNISDYVDIAICGIILVLVYFIINDLGFFRLVTIFSNNYASLPVVFIIGLTAGLSTCMALVGGLVLGASARFAEKHPTATSLQKFKPHLFFNLGRIIFYFILGGIIGFAGSFFQLSPSTLGFLTITVGVIMLLLGLQLTGLFPRLEGTNITLPKRISRILGIQEHSKKEYSHKNSFIMGGLTFFLPCGFTQAMQLYAISSGNPITGAMTMGIFALGTAPGLLGIGGLTSIIKGIFAKTFFKFAGLVVVFLALFNLLNGYNLTGLNIDVFSAFNNATSVNSNDPNVVTENGVQTVKMTQTSSGYAPNSFTIKKGLPVKWVINSTDPYSCAASIVSAKIGVRQSLQPGENTIEFTPQETGEIRFSCSMGMYNGVFYVIDPSETTDTNITDVVSPIAKENNLGLKPSGCGSSGCGGAKKQVQAGTKLGTAPPITPVPTKPPVIAEEVVKEGESVQLLKSTFTQLDDIQPKSFTVRANTPVRLEIDAKENGYGCMGSIAIPGLSEKIDIFRAGETIVFEFIPAEKGQYAITCAMGVPRGSIIVN